MAKKIASNFKNILICLLLITALSATMLGLVYRATKKPIEDSKVSKKEQAIKQVLPPYDKMEELRIGLESPKVENPFKKDVQPDSLTVYKALNEGKLVGYAVETFSDRGFGGRIRLMAGFLPDGSIYKIEVLSHAETPGLGDKMEPQKSDFSKQFEGKNPENYQLKVTKDGGDVDAITAATISSRAYCDGIEKAFTAIKTLGGQGDE